MGMEWIRCKIERCMKCSGLSSLGGQHEGRLLPEVAVHLPTRVPKKQEKDLALLLPPSLFMILIVILSIDLKYRTFFKILDTGVPISTGRSLKNMEVG